MTMWGTEVSGYQRSSFVPSILWFVLGTLFFLFAVTLRIDHWYFPAVSCWAFALCYIPRSEIRFLATVTEEGLAISEPSTELIPYESINAVLIPARTNVTHHESKFPFPIRIVTQTRILDLPSRLSMPSLAVWRLVMGLIPTRCLLAPTNSRLSDYHQRQIETFGEERVLCYNQRSILCSPPNPQQPIRFLQGVLLSSVAWIALGVILGGKDFAIWIGLGAFLFVIGGAILGLLVRDQRKGLKPPNKWDSASLVIGPMGLAMVQGPISGELKWGEIEKAAPHEKSNAIHIRVAGATIAIQDVYDRPTWIIWEQIRKNLAPEAPSPVS